MLRSACLDRLLLVARCSMFLPGILLPTLPAGASNAAVRCRCRCLHSVWAGVFLSTSRAPLPSADVEDEAEEGEEQEGEEEAGEGEDAEREGDDAGEEGGGAGEEGEEQQQEQQEQQGDEDAAGPATAHRIATRSQDVQAGGRGRGRGGRGGRGRGRGGRSSGGRGKAAKK